MQRDDSSEVVATGGSEDSTSRYTAGHDTQRVVVLNYLPVPSPAGCVHLPCTTSLKCLLVQAGGPNPETPGSTGFSQTNDISLFGRKVTRGKSMAQVSIPHKPCTCKQSSGDREPRDPLPFIESVLGEYRCLRDSQLAPVPSSLIRDSRCPAGPDVNVVRERTISANIQCSCTMLVSRSTGKGATSANLQRRTFSSVEATFSVRRSRKCG